MNNRNLLVREIETSESILGIREDGIVHVYLKEDMELNIGLQMRWLKIYHDLTGGVKSPFIFEAGIGTTVTREARDNAILIEDDAPMGGTAVVVSSMAHALIANFYMKFNKPSIPYRVFKSHDKAIEWLQTLDCYQPHKILKSIE